MAVLKFIRGNATGGVQMCKPHFILDAGEDRDRFAAKISEMITNFPQWVYLVLVLDIEAKEPSLIGFLLAAWENPAPYVWLFQAWTNPEYKGEPFSESVFIRFLTWAEELGLPEVRLMTKRDTDAVHRKWGFAPISQIMSLNVQDAMKSLVYKPKKEEADHGIRKQSGSNEHVQPAASERQQSTGPIIEESGGTGDTAIHRSARGASPRRRSNPKPAKQLQPKPVPERPANGDQPSAVRPAVVQRKQRSAANGELLPAGGG